MKRPYTLRTRIIVFFCVYLGILLTIYSAALNGFISMSQDAAFDKQLAEVSNIIITSVVDTGKVPTTLPLHFQMYTKKNDIPQPLKGLIEGLENGYFEIDTNVLSYHVGIFEVNDMQIYLFYDVTAYEFSEDSEFSLNIALSGVSLCLMFVGWILSLYVSRQIMMPITALVKTIDSFSPEKQFEPLAKYTADDEVGLLVRTINGLIKRIDRFVQREREFTLFASHELRTPISVIKGATELLRSGAMSKNQKYEGPLERIDISVKELEILIQTFLMLARQDQVHNPEDPPCEIKTVIEDVVATYRYLLEGKSVEVILETEEAGVVLAPLPVVNIAVGNLVRNAFQYTISGHVKIIGKTNHIIVCDTGSGPEGVKSNSGSGLGLIIVTRLCERMGWNHTVSGLPEGGTQADLYFS